MERIRLLSLIVPAYQQERKIIRNIRNLTKSLKELKIPFELIVVVDGKVDKTYQKAVQLRSKYIRVLGYKDNIGKGNAIRYGVSKARGDVIGFIDAGMDIDPTGISMLLSHMVWYDADIIIGSKLHPVSQVRYPITRRILSWGYRSLTRTMFGFSVRDTQVGLKFFKRKVAEEVFPYLIVNKFAFDVEFLAVAYSFGHIRIFEAPVKLRFDKVNSTIRSNNFWKIILSMLVDTFGVFYRVKLIHYYEKQKQHKKL